MVSNNTASKHQGDAPGAFHETGCAKKSNSSNAMLR